MRRRTLSAQFLAAFFVAVADGRAGERDWMRVELNMFSGRPNPEWTLTAAEAAELTIMIATLQIAAEPPPPFDGLGYRGIVVRNPAEPGWRLIAFRDNVRVSTLEGGVTRSDPEASIERWLLRAAGDAVDPVLRSRLGY